MTFIIQQTRIFSGVILITLLLMMGAGCNKTEQTTPTEPEGQKTVATETPAQSSLTNVVEPDSIKIYKAGVVTTCSKIEQSERYLKICKALDGSFEPEANPMRMDDSASYVQKTKEKGTGIEFLYSKAATSHYPSFNNTTIDVTYKSLFIPIDPEYPIMIFEKEDGYGTDPIYLKDMTELTQAVQ